MTWPGRLRELFLSLVEANSVKERSGRERAFKQKKKNYKSHRVGERMPERSRCGWSQGEGERLSRTEEVGGEEVGGADQVAPGGLTPSGAGSLAQEQRGATRGL